MNWDITQSIDEYYNWLRQKTTVFTDNQTGWHTITTPFIGLFNDPVEIYAKLKNDKLLLSDDGMTLKNLELTGVSINRSQKRKEWFDMICLNYGITLKNGELTISGTLENFNQYKHNLVTAICEISDMQMLAKNTVAYIFKEDVKAYLDEQEIIYTPNFIAKGSTGIDFNFDFQIAGREKEIVIKSFNSLNKMNVPNFLFTWDDIKQTRKQASRKELMGLAIINNEDKTLNSEYTKALQKKGADFMLWDKRYQPEMIKKLVA